MAKFNLPGHSALLLGIGGSGMSSLAHILLDMGVSVYGYDKKSTAVTSYLTERGAKIAGNLDQIEIKDIEFMVFSSAINDKNHSIFEDAKNLNIPMFHRSDVLHKIFSQKKSISVAGSHGKTSTTAMIAQVLKDQNLSPSVMVGGEVPFLGKRGGQFGAGEWGVYESDESDGTFLKHKANLRIITNIDNDHLDFYHSREKLEEAFFRYIATDTPGHVIVQGMDEGIRNMICHLFQPKPENQNFNLWILLNLNSLDLEYKDKLDQIRKHLTKNLHIIPYEFKKNGISFQVQEQTYQLELPFSGQHYSLNGLTAFIALHIVGIPAISIQAGLNAYQGVKRRQEVLGTANSITVIDDYGHHPTEIATVIHSLKNQKKDNGKLIVLFQPHRYTRTANLKNELADSLVNADYIFLLPIYSAGEAIIPGISSESIAENLNSNPWKILKGEVVEDVTVIDAHLHPGDTLLCIGAGNVRDWGEYYLQEKSKLKK
ncbi:UDP-N-acetylmuramate--L-alanine ligase [Leptospira ryugenii]|uniref:UDP-N-acetylmuramate--L-alanine ligase n=2 Tax=Leptospira ryugenii TaxID=1917863 RepID=A0A2P2DWX8_9LEPT|nr:UDP-N-acetylmuramate--L-alanine ligase [Leptospira ryugenii]